jgi:hypothetical protein
MVHRNENRVALAIRIFLLSNIFKAQVVNFLPVLYCTSVYGSATENLLRHTNFMFFGKTIYLYHACINIYLLIIIHIAYSLA